MKDKKYKLMFIDGELKGAAHLCDRLPEELKIVYTRDTSVMDGTELMWKSSTMCIEETYKLLSSNDWYYESDREEVRGCGIYSSSRNWKDESLLKKTEK